ncbi:MAG TPA: hypothetical protein VGR78_04315 [Verrucomicrobiae bacterium]|nr:hypothetical protein [Verrucomicrobiae bacterium]
MRIEQIETALREGIPFEIATVGGDMHGNTFEWCRDWYRSKLPGGVDPDLPNRSTPRPKNAAGTRRAFDAAVAGPMRGGHAAPPFACASSRSGATITSGFGWRLL